MKPNRPLVGFSKKQHKKNFFKVIINVSCMEFYIHLYLYAYANTWDGYDIVILNSILVCLFSSSILKLYLDESHETYFLTTFR